jgi:hypothetical protein
MSEEAAHLMVSREREGERERGGAGVSPLQERTSLT